MFVHWVPNEIKPADPLRTLQTQCNGDRKVANAQTWGIYDQLRSRPDVAQYMGVHKIPIPMKAVQLSPSVKVMQEPGGGIRT